MERPAMGSLTTMLLAILAIYASSLPYTEAQCPVLTGISPPSGGPMFDYYISGSNLDQVANVTSSSVSSLNVTMINSTSIRFNFLGSASGSITITLAPVQSGCNQVSDTIFLVLSAPLISQLSSTEGQPGTVIRFRGCFPPACGDNSSNYSVTVGGVQVMRFNPSVLSEDFSLFTIRLVEIDSEILQAPINLVTQYGTVFPFQSHTINYRLAGNITSVSPSTGQRGTLVTITGSNLLGHGDESMSLNIGSVTLHQVELGTNQAEVISSSQTQVVVRAGTGPAGVGNVRLNSTQTVNGIVLNGPYTFLAGSWTQREDGLVTEITPPAAQAGSTVFLCGTSLYGGGSSIINATVIGNVANFTSSLVSDPIPGSPTECVSAIVPAASGTTMGAVTLTANTNALIESQTGVTFQYASINSPTPSSGQSYTQVTITGTELLSGYGDSQVTTAVFLSGVQATVINASPQQVIVTAGVPPMSAINTPGGVVIRVTISGLSFQVALQGAWTYLSEGQINMTDPSFGQRGTRITLNGMNLLGYGSQLTAANILGTGSTSATATIVSGSATEVVLGMPSPVMAGYTGPATIELIADNGARVTGMNMFEYRTEGVITAVQPTSGQDGTFVTITGTNLFGYGDSASSVMLGQVNAQIIHNMSTNSSIYARAGSFSTASNTAVRATITSNTFAQVQSTTNIWTYIPPGQITSISPAEGQFGSTITITGTNLRGGGSSVASVVMDGVPGTVLSESDTMIRVTLGDDDLRDSSQYPGQVFIQANTGAIVIGAPFQQRAPGSITSFSPIVGRLGTEITITGNDLTGFGTSISTVEIAGVSALPGPYSTTQSDTMLVVQAAFASTNTSGPIRLTINTGAIIESTQNFNYLQNGSIAMITPTVGAEGSGILIRGQYLRTSTAPITSVTIGGSEVSRIVAQSDTELAVIAGPAPNSSLSNLPIRLTAEDESFIERNLFTYQNLVLSITGTNQGQHGTRVTLNIPFSVNEIITATVDDQEATILTRNEISMTISVEIPRARRTGQYTVDITVESSNHTIARLRDGFTYLTESHISSIDPVQGQMGTRVTIFGQNLYGGGTSISSVTVRGIATKILGSSQTMVNISLSENPSSMSSFPLTSSISVVANTGAITERIDAFSFVQPGNITSISPTSGQRGTRVTINGANLLQGTLQVSSVRLAGVLAQVSGSPSNTEIQVVASTSMPNYGSVEITLSSGAFINSTDVAFQYNTAGSITSVSPKNGTIGTRMTIQGTGLLGGGASISTVRLDGVIANVSSTSDTSIIVVAQQAADSATPGRVEIVSDTGSIVSVDASWSYSQLGSITSITPSIGQKGIMVTISGTNLLGSSGGQVTSVTLAGVSATVVSSTNSTVVVRAGYISSAATGPVQLTVDSGPMITSMSTTVWSYYNASLNSISPSSGVNGTMVTITGVNLLGPPNSTNTVDQVTLAGIEATDIQVLSPNSIRVRAGVSPQTSLDSARVTSSSGAYLELSNAWQYEEPGLVNSIQPPMAYPGDTVTITGERLVPMGTTNVRVVIGQSEAFSATVTNTAELKVIPGPYHELDQPNTPLPVLIEADDGATVVSGMFTYNATAGMVTGISPAAGGSGSRVTITGTGLLNGAPPVSVYLAGVQATIVSSNDTEIVVDAGTGSDISGSVVVQANNSRQIGRGGNAWTYLPALTASMVSPQTGRNGTLVKINLGAIPNEYTLQSVQLGDIAGTIVSTVKKIVTVAANTSSSSTPVGSITLTFQNSTVLTIPSAWSYLSPTTITTGSSDLMGYFNSLVTLSGTNFQGSSGVQVATATLAGINTAIVSQSNTELRLRIEDNLNSSAANISGPIVLVFDDGAVFNSQEILFTYLQLNVASVSPTAGQYRTRVSIQGTGLLAGGSSISAMNFSGVAVDNITSQSNTEIVASAAAFNAASTTAGDTVYMLDTGAQVTIPASWSYVTPGEITSVDPTSGNRGTIVTITGRNMLGGGAQAGTVYLNSIQAEDVLISSDTLIRVRAGASTMQSPGIVRIIANTEAELTSQANLFAYRQPGSISSISPSSGQYETRVTVTGVRFDDGEGIRRITVAGVEAEIESANSTSVIANLQRPTRLGAFQGTIVIESNQGTVTESTQNFNYLQEGFIATLTPSQGQRGTRITLSGSGLRGGGNLVQSATIAGTQADIMSQTNTEVVLMAGENADSVSGQVMGDIVLTADTGAQVTRVNGWTYVRYGIISSVTPSTGQYGTRITLSGTDLTAGASSVQEASIGGITAFEIVTSSPTQVVFRAGEPFSSNLTNGSITLISSDGGNLTSQATWTYQTPGMITSVSPANGTGSMSVTITGINLLGGGTNVTQVTVAGIATREIDYSNVNNTIVTFTTGFNDNGAELTGDIVIEANTGALTIADNSWTYISECPTGEFGNTNSCMPCDVECQQCRGPTEFDCFDCRNFRIENGTQTQCVELCPTLSTTDKECVESCESNQYEETDLSNVTFCRNCAEECDPNLGCSGSSNTITDCTRCRDVAHNGLCTSECPIGTFNDRGTCTSCSAQCEFMQGCTGSSAADCNQCSNFTLPGSSMLANTSTQDICVESCPRNFYVDTNKVCRPCNPECRDSCTGPMASQCIACSAASIAYSNGSRICVPDCNPNAAYRSLFQDVTTGVCQQCSPLCSLAVGCTGPSPANCMMCRNFTGSNQDESEFLPRYGGQCVMQCPDNPSNNTYFYADLRTGMCMPCSSQCTNDCTGPQPSDCNEFSPQQQAFGAGAGTVALVIIIILFLFIALVAVSAILVWKIFFNNKDNYIPQHIGIEGGLVLEQKEQSTRIDIPEMDNSDVLWSSESPEVKRKSSRVPPPDEYILMQSPTKKPQPYEMPVLKEKEKIELEETYAEMDGPPPEENYTEMEIQTPPSSPFPEPESPDSDQALEQDSPSKVISLEPVPPRPPKPSTKQEDAEEKPLPPVPAKPDEGNDDVIVNPTANSDAEDNHELPEKLEGGVSLSQENIYDDTEVVSNRYVDLPGRSVSPSSDISDPLPPPPTLPGHEEEEENLYDDTEASSPIKDTEPLVSHIDDVYEDTDDATMAAKEYLKMTASPPLPDKPAQNPPVLPPRPQQIPKRLSNTPLPAPPTSPSSASVASLPIPSPVRPQSVTSLPEEEQLYEELPGSANATLIEESKPKKAPQPKPRGLKGKLSFGRK